jgi:hypothetical protein
MGGMGLEGFFQTYTKRIQEIFYLHNTHHTHHNLFNNVGYKHILDP